MVEGRVQHREQHPALVRALQPGMPDWSMAAAATAQVVICGKRLSAWLRAF